MQEWIWAVGTKTAYIERGSPLENGYIESFNARLRDEFLNGETFHSLREAQIVIESWRRVPPKIVQVCSRSRTSCGVPLYRATVQFEPELTVRRTPLKSPRRHLPQITLDLRHYYNVAGAQRQVGSFPIDVAGL